MTSQDFNELLIQQQEYLRPFSISLTQNEEEAKDLVQDTLYRAIVNQEKYKPGSNLKAWLFTIMRNIFINNYRRRESFRKMSSGPSSELLLFTNQRYALNAGISRTGLGEIAKVMDRLPMIFKRSFLLHYEGYKYQEIADHLNEPLGTIKSRIHFARKMLMDQLPRS